MADPPITRNLSIDPSLEKYFSGAFSLDDWNGLEKEKQDEIEAAAKLLHLHSNCVPVCVSAHSATPAAPPTEDPIVAPVAGVGAEAGPREGAVPKWAGFEHRMLIPYNLKEKELVLRHANGSDPGLKVKYGDMVALGGDFVGDRDQPISGLTNVASALEAQDTFKKLFGIFIKDWQQSEVNGVMEKLVEGPEDIDALDKASGYRMKKLLTTNWDHFSTDAKIAFEAAIDLAESFAAAQGTITDPNDGRLVDLEAKALVCIAWACHFLSDAFASGHVRVPRRQLHTYGPEVAGYAVGDALSNLMHEEDGDFGLYLQSEAHPTPWLAFGDFKFGEDANKANKEKVLDAVRKATEYATLKDSTHRKDAKKELLSCLPTVAGDSHNSNRQPLFKLVNDEVYVRYHEDDVRCKISCKLSGPWAVVLAGRWAWKHTRGLPCRLGEEEYANDPDHRCHKCGK